jgi:hypothetical protein
MQIVTCRVRKIQTQGISRFEASDSACDRERFAGDIRSSPSILIRSAAQPASEQRRDCRRSFLTSAASRAHHYLTCLGGEGPDFSLPNHNGKLVSLGMMLEEGPVAVSLYRGKWWPYCKCGAGGSATRVARNQSVRRDSGSDLPTARTIHP